MAVRRRAVLVAKARAPTLAPPRRVAPLAAVVGPDPRGVTPRGHLLAKVGGQWSRLHADVDVGVAVTLHRKQTQPPDDLQGHIGCS
ncbi:hypothetical protein EYF80_043577 [Liparis tanakae]|uniref:Uncharacterized protein n=1 Tax=Liparis tanakae TaxID=230148 RepID=A0A4Z2FYE7_9TELE|nr:hypothetical protein EYF80_043577 [Liparis tanakae]